MGEPQNVVPIENCRSGVQPVVAHLDPETPEQEGGPWGLVRGEEFDDLFTVAELRAAVARRAARSATPHADVLRQILGMEMTETEARSLVRRLAEHHRQMSRALGRAVHVRVAALDLLTTQKARGARRDSRPLVVTQSVLERALEEASADPLTGLPQRGQFMSLLRHELRQRRPRAVTVAFVDLDGFKEVNDAYGHARGDDVLLTLARTARSVLRHGDVVARIGGDEFALMLLDVDAPTAATVVARLRERFEGRTARFGTSFSAGVAVARAGEPAEDVLARADALMYEEKRARALRRR